MLKLVVNADDKLDDIIITEDTSIEINLENCNKSINIDVMEDKCLEVFERDINTNNQINYNIRANSTVIVNKISRDNSDITRVNLNGENASIKYHTSILNYNDNVYDIKIFHNKDNTYSDVINHAINFTDTEFKFLVDSKIDKKLKGCICNQDSKIINMKNGHNYITPNLLIDSEDIEAEHAAYIGKFKESEIFYLMSRGISFKDSEKLLANGFLLNKMNLTGSDLEDFNKFIEDNFNM